jgi:hypothetical protein
MKTDSLIGWLARDAGIASRTGGRKAARADGKGMEHSR